MPDSSSPEPAPDPGLCRPSGTRGAEVGPASVVEWARAQAPLDGTYGKDGRRQATHLLDGEHTLRGRGTRIALMGTVRNGGKRDRGHDAELRDAEDRGAQIGDERDRGGGRDGGDEGTHSTPQRGASVGEASEPRRKPPPSRPPDTATRKRVGSGDRGSGGGNGWGVRVKRPRDDSGDGRFVRPTKEGFDRIFGRDSSAAAIEGDGEV